MPMLAYRVSIAARKRTRSAVAVEVSKSVATTIEASQAPSVPSTGQIR